MSEKIKGGGVKTQTSTKENITAKIGEQQNRWEARTPRWKRRQVRNEDRTRFQTLWCQQIFFAPPHAVWVGHCHITNQLTWHLLTDHLSLGYRSSILQKSLCKKNWAWPRGGWRGHCWVIPAGRREAEGTSHTLGLVSCWAEDQRGSSYPTVSEDLCGAAVACSLESHAHTKSVSSLALRIFERIEWSLMRWLLGVSDHLTSNSAFN